MNGVLEELMLRNSFDMIKDEARRDLVLEKRELKFMKELKVFRYKLPAIIHAEENLKKKLPQLMSTSETRFGFGDIIASFTGEVNVNIVRMFKSSFEQDEMNFCDDL